MGGEDEWINIPNSLSRLWKGGRNILGNSNFSGRIKKVDDQVKNWLLSYPQRMVSDYHLT